MIENVFDDALSDQELSCLLSLWQSPQVPDSLSQRFAHILTISPAINNPEPLRFELGPVEVSMKKCNACAEQFEDKFSFCPVDGSPLNRLAAAIVGDSNRHLHESYQLPAGEVQSRTDLVSTFKKAEYRLTLLSSSGLRTRLTGELRFCLSQFKNAWPNFKRDPLGFSKRQVVDSANALRERLETSGALASLITAVVLVMAAVLFVVLSGGSGRNQLPASQTAEEGLADIVTLTPAAASEPSGRGIGAGGNGRVGFDKGNGEGSSAARKRSHGGGSGGLRDPLPVPKGKIPVPSEISAPIPKLASARNPALPAAGIDIDPALWKALPIPVYGDPKSSSTTPSNGPGEGGGLGTVKGQGIGDGNGDGFGLGTDGNIGDGPREPGGERRGGAEGNDPNAQDHVFRASMVNQRARVLAKPEPQYTEEARRNQITGTVVLRVVFSKTGDVTSIRAINSLPYGLTERAIAAARKIRFLPATKDNQAVSVQMQLEYNFNLY